MDSLSRTTRALHNLSHTEAIPGISELTGNVNSIAEEANRIGVQKVIWTFRRGPPLIHIYLPS